MVKAIQTTHMNKFTDIGYNFLVGGDGVIYEGRGWDFVGAHTKGQNAQSIGIAFIGTFDKTPAEQTQIDAAQALIAEGVRLNVIGADYKVFGQRQFISQSPGDKLYQVLQKWPQWQKLD